MRIKARDYQETQKLGLCLGQLLQAGDVLLVSGELGAGKTTLIQGLAIGMGINANVTSPTFTIIHEYPGALPLYHIDAYRLDNPLEIDDLGLEEYFYGAGVTAIEWAEKIVEWLPSGYLHIYINKLPDQNDHREIVVKQQGCGRYGKLLEELRKNCGY